MNGGIIGLIIAIVVGLPLFNIIGRLYKRGKISQTLFGVLYFLLMLFLGIVVFCVIWFNFRK